MQINQDTIAANEGTRSGTISSRLLTGRLGVAYKF
jgi:hypothetical protein